MEYDLSKGRSRKVATHPKGEITHLIHDLPTGETLYSVGSERYLGGAKGWSKGSSHTIQNSWRVEEAGGRFDLGGGREVARQDDGALKLGTYSFKLPDTINSTYLTVLKTSSPEVHYLEVLNSGASAGSSIDIYRLYWTTSVLETKIQHKENVDFHPSSRYWAAIDGRRPMAQLKDGRQVWVAAGYFGDLQTGKEWTLTPKLAWTTNVAVRPGL